MTRNRKQENRSADLRIPVRPRILHLHCGGTIGMTAKVTSPELREVLRQRGMKEHHGIDGTLEPTMTGYQVLHASPIIKEMLRRHVDIRTENVFIKDSSEVTLEDVKNLIGAIEQNKRQYDAILITHGTDKLVDTASLLSYAYGGKPDFFAVFTGSMAPHGRLGGDSITSIERALDTAFSAIHRKKNGIVISSDDRILDPHHCRKERLNEYDAHRGPLLLGRHTPEGIHWFRQPSKRHTTSTGFLPFYSPSYETMNVDSNTSRGHLSRRVKAAAKMMGIGKRPAALIFQVPGGENLPREHGSVIDEANKLGVPIILISRSASGEEERHQASPYRPAVEAKRKGVISIGNIAPDEAERKLCWLLGVAHELMKNGELKADGLVHFLRRGFSHRRSSEPVPPTHVKTTRLPVVRKDPNGEPRLALTQEFKAELERRGARRH